ncbi:MAG: hypothetical protein FWG05_05645, partial [Kiritimatiellaeota bacterium]|nr:hypothetical protein [Kiritimatiellota bacterium]
MKYMKNKSHIKFHERMISCFSCISLFIIALSFAGGCKSTPKNAGTMLRPHDGMTIRDSATGALLVLDPPELFAVEKIVAPPANHNDKHLAGYMWDGAQGFMPRYDDEDGSIILGGAFRQTVPESLEITSTNGALLYIESRDYVLNKEWGQFVAIDTRLGADPVHVKASLAMQRIDLVQRRAADGSLAVKKGVSRLVCPRRPEPDEGFVAMAGIYVAPWRRGGVWTVTQEDIFPILNKKPASLKPAPKTAVPKTRAKLNAGAPVKIAFIGDSITLGAEAGKWWDDDGTTF